VSNALVLDKARNLATAAACVAELVAATEATPSDRITVLGGGQIELLIAFLRHGFDDVACLSSTRNGSGVGEADIVIAPAIDNETELAALLCSLGRALRPGGNLVVRLTETAALRNQQQLLPIFLKSGFAAVERRASSGNLGSLWLARKQSKISARAA